LITSANGFGAPGAAAGLAGGRAAAAGAAAGAPATVALVADDAGAPTGVLLEAVAAAVAAGGVTVAQDDSNPVIAMNRIEREATDI
jgi:hypothetical protein